MIALTGASGFLGREVARALLRRGDGPLRLLVRPGTAPARLEAAAGVEVVSVRLDDAAGLRQALEGVRVLHHLAAAKRGPPSALVASTVSASERVFQAALAARVSRVVLVSSFGVMGVAGLARGAVVDEDVPLEPHPERRDAYSFAKLRQEELAWRCARQHGLPLVVVRPGFVFGPGQELLGSRIGLSAFGLFLHLGGGCRVPLTYVENCADAVALAGAAPGVEGQIFNLVDDDLPTSRALLARHLREVAPLRVVPIPYPLLRQLARLNAWYSARTDGHLPPVFTPYKVASMWKPQRYTNAKAKRLLGWIPRVSMPDALDRTFAALAPRPAPPAPVPLRLPLPGPAGGGARGAGTEANA